MDESTRNKNGPGSPEPFPITWCKHSVYLSIGEAVGSVKLLEEIISVFSPQNSPPQNGVWTRRDSNLRRLRGV